MAICDSKLNEKLDSTSRKIRYIWTDNTFPKAFTSYHAKHANNPTPTDS